MLVVELVLEMFVEVAVEFVEFIDKIVSFLE